MSRISNDAWDAFVKEPSEGNFRRLYEETSPLVYTVCMRILGHEGDARDAFQSTYCRLLGAAREGRREPAAGELVVRTAVREADALRHRRDRRARREVLMSATHEDRRGQGAADEIAAQRQIRERVESLVEQLPAKYRLPVALHYFDGLTHDEIAAAVGATRSTVSNRIARGLRALEPTLKRAGLGETAVVLGALLATQGLGAVPPALDAASVFANAQAALVKAGALAGSAAASGASGVSVLAALAMAAKTKAALVTCAALLAAAAVAFVAVNPWRGEERTPSDTAMSAPEERGGEAATAASRQTKSGSRRGERGAAAVDGATSIFGRITIAETGRPAAGATVVVLTTEPVATATAKSDGTYEIEGLAPGQVYVAAFTGPYVSHLRQQDVVPSTIEAQRRNGPFDLALRRGLVVSGTVADETTGAGLARAGITTRLLGERTVVTGAGGAYRMEGLPAMELKFDIRADGFARTLRRVMPREGDPNLYHFALEKEGVATVLVTDAEGKPLPGAKVAFFVDASFTGWDGAAVTGVDGRATLSGLSVRTPPRLTAARNGYEVRESVSPVFEGDSRRTEATIVMRSAVQAPARGAFAGRVVDQEGKAVAGARVVWSDARYPNNGSSKTATDAEGRYTLEVAADAASGYQLGVASTGLAPAWRRDVVPGTRESPATVDFTLQPGQRLEGVVIGPDGQPRAGVFVCPYVRGEDQYAPCEILGQPGAAQPYRTDGAGRFRLENLPAGEILLDLWGTGVSYVRKQPCAAGTAVSIVMKSAGVIRGVVTDKRSGAPIRAFTVKLAIDGGAPEGSGRTFSAADGRFLLDELNQDSSYTVAIDAAGYPQFVRAQVTAVAPESETEETFALPAGNALSGALVDAADEKPIAGATVIAVVTDTGILDWARLDERGAGRTPPSVRAVTDGAGAFALEEGNRPFTLFVRAKGYGRLVLRPEDRAALVKGEGRELRIALAPAAAIEGTLLVAKEALANAELYLTYEGQPRCTFERVCSDAAGAFRFDDLPAGPYRLTVYRQEGRLGFGWVSRGVTLRAGIVEQVAIGADFGTGTLTGRVLDAEGRPVAEVRVGVTPKFESAYSEFADYTAADGSYRIEHLRPGDYSASAWKYAESQNGLRELRASAAIGLEGDTTHDFVFAAKRKVTARVRAEGAPAAAEAYLSLLDTGAARADGIETSSSCRIAGDRIVLEGVFKGAYRLEVARRGAARAEARYQYPTVLALDTNARDVDLGEVVLPALGACSLSGAVLGPDEEPMPGAMLTLEPAFKWDYWFLRAWADAQGRFRIDGVREGAYDLRVVGERTGNTQRVLVRRIEIRASTEETIRFEAEHVVTLRLRLDGGAMQGTAVTNATFSRLGWDCRVPYGYDGILNMQNGEVRGESVRFSGRLKGEYVLELGYPHEQRSLYVSLPGTFALDNLAGDQDLGEVRVPAADGGTAAVTLAFEGAGRPEYGFAYFFPDGDRRRKHLVALDLRAATHELGPLPAGTYEVAVGAPGFRCEPPFLTLTLGAGAAAPACAFTLTPQGVVKGYGSFYGSPRLREARIEGPGVSRSIRPAAGASPAFDMLLARQDLMCPAWFVFADLPAGRYTVTVEAEGCEPSSQTVDVVPGRESSLSFERMVPRE